MERVHLVVLFSFVALAASDATAQIPAAPASIGQRAIAVPGSSVVLTLWQETDALGSVTPFYAISLDGKSVATVRSTSYELNLRRATFDPLVSEPSFAGSPVAASNEIYFVQFLTQPLEEFRSAITALGGTIHDYVSNHAYIVRMSPAVRARVAALPYVRWTGAMHGEYRIDDAVLAALEAGTLPPIARYNVVVFERGLAQKQVVADRIVALGGTIDNLIPSGFRFEATFSAAALCELAGLDEVAYIDPWGAPQTDMDIARLISGAVYIEPLGVPAFDGTGVRGEVMDDGVQFDHPEFTTPPGSMIIAHGVVANGSHGTCTTGEIFANGNNAQATGLLHNGQGIVSSFLTVTDRYALTAELVNPSLQYKAVFQSNSWGDPQTTQYTSKSQEIDDIIFINDILICQSMSNTGSTLCRPQAWGKNIVSVGGVIHHDTLTKADDNWGGASIGPAADGRIKPDFAHFYDNIFTTAAGGGYTSGFNGTSGATPITCGYFGLFFQMWGQAIFGNTPTIPGGTVFQNRSHCTLAKAMMINNASQYDWLAGGPNATLTRIHQGWGMVDVKRVYDYRAKMLIVDETDVLTNLQSKSYQLTVLAGEPELKATLVYLDPAGAVSASQHRKNDLSLKVTSPSSTVYWGNNGLLAGLWSTSGGVANTKDTVENVFVQNPQAGQWTVEVIGSDINTDARVETVGVIDADFALVVSGVETCATPATYCTAKVNSLGCTPSMSSVGTPSATAGSGFIVSGNNVRNNKNGLLFYGMIGAQAIPFQGGTLCVKTPLKRTPGTNSLGNPFPANDCSGVYNLDMNAFAVGGLGGSPDALLTVVGTVVHCQFWGRDPGFPAPNNTTLTNGLTYTVCP